MDRLNWYQEMGWSYKESQHKITFWSFNPSHDWLLRMTWSVLKSSQLWSLISFRSMFSLLEDSSHVWAPRSVTGSLLGHVNPAAIPEMWGSSFSYRLVHCWLLCNNSPQKTPFEHLEKCSTGDSDTLILLDHEIFTNIKLYN